MPSFRNHDAATRSKVMVVGEGGSGKTSLLASLANADYNLRILDYDGGLEVLHSYVDADKIDNIVYRTCTDDGQDEATGFRKGVNLLFKAWKTDDEDLGHIKTWTNRDVLVIDTVTFMAEAAKRLALHAAGRKPTDNLTQADWGTAQRLVENVLNFTSSSLLSCNVVMLAHPTHIEDQYGAARTFPATCGRGLDTRVSRYFNNVWRLDLKRERDGGFTRILRTTADHRMGLKNSAPLVIKPEEPADLAVLFEKLQGAAGAKTKSTS